MSLANQRNSHCSFCGGRYPPEAGWPRICAICSKTTYRNPLPVAVLLVPTSAGLLAVRRGIQPKLGQLALPGGYIDFGETWMEACVREVREETGLEFPAAEVRHHATLSSELGDGVLIVFGRLAFRSKIDLSDFQPTAETSELTFIREPSELCFPLHVKAAEAYFSENR